ncbi:small ribosomal subunit protein uS9c-like isoform X2 [Musa acuminata AAA Group]|uniref:small ribosomal subunit protein uS9c-like isoform X2 n=1 Tax=Musa acuminata AAA Group TaxID=214697 RepID=UPI0031D0225D
MATTSLSSLTVAFSSLSFSSHVSSSNKTLYSPWIRHRRTASPLRWNSPTAIASSTTSFPIAAVSGGAAVSAEDFEGVSLEKYVKSRLPGGFAAQRLIGTGRRKCAIARVVLQEGTGKFVINYRDAKEYLQGNPLWLQYIKTPLLTLGFESSYDVFVKAQGGGLSGQAQAISLGIARALLKVSQNHRSPLKKEGLLTRDSRVVERKKVGLKKARKAPQYSKR